MAPLKELLLTLTYIRRVSFAPGDSDRHMIEIAVANTLLEHRDQARNVMDSLQVLSNDRMERRAAIVRSDIRSHLQNRGFVLLDSPDFRNDFKKLDNWTRDQISLDASAGQDILRIGSHRIQIARPVQEQLYRASSGESFLVIGEAGVGKTGALLKLTKDLRSAGSRVLYWKADSIQRESGQQMRQEVFHLDHTWNDIFEEAASQSQTIIIIDGLDSIRDARVSGVFQSLIGLARSKKLTVIASIRVFDLSDPPELRKLFPLEGDPILETFKQPFCEMKHIFIPELGDEELNQVQSQFGAVLQILSCSPPSGKSYVLYFT